MKEKDKKWYGLVTCDSCSDNKNTCFTCKNSANCKGCVVCDTKTNEMCHHCDIICVHENNCQYRIDWIESFSKKEDNIMIENTLCNVCPWDFACSENDGLCPFEKIFHEKQAGNDMTKDTITSKNKIKEYKYKKFNNDVWDSGLSCIDECPDSKDITLHISVDVYYKLRFLQETFTDVEFTVYANAIKQEDGIYSINDIVIPKQRVGGASVDDIEIEGHYNTIIHKHPGENPGGFSHVDNEYANSNHDFSVLIGSKNLNSVIGVGRVLTECKKYIRVSVKVEIQAPPITDTFFLESVENIKKNVYYKYGGGNVVVWEGKDKGIYDRWT